MKSWWGSQKRARYKRLRLEILDYVRKNPNCTAADITATLCIERKMHNFSLTPQKVGNFIPRHCKEIRWERDGPSGKRIYWLRSPLVAQVSTDAEEATQVS